MKTYKQLSGEVNDIHHDIEMSIALLIKKYHLQNVEWHRSEAGPVTLNPQLGYVQVHFITTDGTANMINAFDIVECLDLLEQIENYITENKL